MEKRVLAFHMAQLGDVSTNRQALEGASLTTSDERTLKALKDPARRPAPPFALNQELFVKNVPTARNPHQDHPA